MLAEGIRIAQSRAQDARQAAQEFHAAVMQPDTQLVIFFCSSRYDLAALGDELARLFAGIQLVGCTTAGEIGPSGYHQHSLSGAGFAAPGFSAVSGLIENLRDFDIARGLDFGRDLLQRLEQQAPGANADNSFALTLIDGMSIREESVAHALQHALGKIMLLGGSAGDDLQFARTRVYHQGAFHDDSAVLILLSTGLPFKVFKTQHFVTTGQRLVVTAADTGKRVVTEINGLPAAQEYARLAGVDVLDLNPARFAASPVVVTINGTDYVRSIQKANPDGSLTFYCAIEEGLVLRVAHGVDLMQNLTQTFEKIRAEIGPPQVVIGFDCVLRGLEMEQDGLKPGVGQILQNNNMVGFSSYGEQFHGVHVNQTLTGIAIGGGPLLASESGDD